MKTSHQFARELLAGPDLPIGFIEGSEGQIMNPAVQLLSGYAKDGERSEMLEIGQEKEDTKPFAPTWTPEMGVDGEFMQEQSPTADPLSVAFVRQEKLTSALWGFAYDLQHAPHDVKAPDGTTVNLAAILRAQSIILAIFAQERVEVQ